MGLHLGEGKHIMNDLLIEGVFRNIPECLLFIFSGYAFSKYKVQGKRYFLSVLILALIGFIITGVLTISFGVKQILVIIVCVTLLTRINQIPLQKAIASAFGVMILGFIADIISVIIAAVVKGGDVIAVLSDKTLFNSIYDSELEQQLFGSISLAIMAIVLLSVYFIAKKRGKLKDVPAGKSIE